MHQQRYYMFLEDMARVRYYPLGNILPQCIVLQWVEGRMIEEPRAELAQRCWIQRDSNNLLDKALSLRSGLDHSSKSQEDKRGILELCVHQLWG